jgi:hypothetical protein
MQMVHDAIAYAPYELRFINQIYAAYELLFDAERRGRHSQTEFGNEKRSLGTRKKTEFGNQKNINWQLFSWVIFQLMVVF